MPAETILDEIVRWKRLETAARQQERPLADVRAQSRQAPPPRDLVAALRGPGVSLIAEVKKASPSKGLLCPNLDPAALARTYEENGAAAISVLTDERYFYGRLDYLTAVRRTVRLPALRKDFILEPYQLYEARAAEADGVLLIVAALPDDALADLHRLATDLGLTVLVEVHDEAEVERALRVAPRLVGVNNRDLRTFTVDLGTTERLRPLVPPDVALVAESGIHTRADVARLAAAGVDAMLVGEALVCAGDVGRKMRELLT